MIDNLFLYGAKSFSYDAKSFSYDAKSFSMYCTLAPQH